MTATRARETAGKVHGIGEQSSALPINRQGQNAPLLTFRTSSIVVVGAVAFSLLLMTPSKIPCAIVSHQIAALTPEKLVKGSRAATVWTGSSA